MSSDTKAGLYFYTYTWLLLPYFQNTQPKYLEVRYTENYLPIFSMYISVCVSGFVWRKQWTVNSFKMLQSGHKSTGAPVLKGDYATSYYY